MVDGGIGMGEPRRPQFVSFWREGVPAAWRAFPSLLVYESVWKFATLAILGPLGVALLHAIIRLGGDVAVANTQLIAFALSPLGFSTLMILAIVSVAFTFIERAGLYHILFNSLHQRHTSCWRTFAQTLRAGPRIVSVALLQVALFLGALLPFLAAAWLTYSLLLTEWDINFYLAERPSEFFVAVAIAAGLGLAGAVVGAILYVRWAFAVPVVVFEGRHFTSALRGSATLVKGWGWLVLGVMLGWELFRYLLYAVAFLGLKELNELILVALGHTGSAMLIWVAVLMILDVVILTGVVIVETVVFCLVITVLYENSHRHQECQAALTAHDPEVASRATAEVQTCHPRLAALESAGGRLPRRLAVFSAIALVLVLGVTAWQTASIAQEFRHRHRIYVTAHRAGAKDAPENTLAALRKAIEVGADYAEIDVQRTKDGIVVVLHDKDFKRLTGAKGKVWELTYEQVRDLTFTKKKGKTGPAASDGKIATLEEFITTAQGKIKLNIELKYYKEHFDRDLAKQVVRMIEDHHFVDQCVVTSLEPGALVEVRKLNPAIHTGIIVAADLGNIAAYDVNFLSLKRTQITAALRRLATNHKLQIHAWDVESRTDMEMMIHLGTDNLITDDPALAMEVRDWYENLSDGELILFNFRNWLRS
jgi:glycerophosphoryl diester phosphodiesterase